MALQTSYGHAEPLLRRRLSLAAPTEGHLGSAQWADVVGGVPTAAAIASLADADTLIDGGLSVRAWCAEHLPLTTVLPYLTNPSAVGEIAQWKVTFGHDMRNLVDPFLLADTPYAGMPLTPTRMERRWARTHSAWFATSAPAATRTRAPRPAAAHALEQATWYGPAESDEVDGIEDVDELDVSSQLMALTGESWPTSQVGVQVPGELDDAVAALAVRVGTCPRLRRGTGVWVLGRALAALAHLGGAVVSPLQLRVNVLDMAASLTRAPLSSLAFHSSRGAGADPINRFEWAEVALPGQVETAHGLAVRDTATGTAWATLATW